VIGAIEAFGRTNEGLFTVFQALSVAIEGVFVINDGLFDLVRGSTGADRLELHELGYGKGSLDCMAYASLALFLVALAGQAMRPPYN
jgi:hypothetical protein